MCWRIRSLSPPAPLLRLIFPAAASSTDSSPAPSRSLLPPTLPFSPARINPLCSQYFTIGLPWQQLLCASSFSWCGNIKSSPPPWMSKVSPRISWLIAEHSMCHPGRPLPHGLSQEISPGLADFQSAKSPAERFLAAALAAFALLIVEASVGELTVIRDPSSTSKNTSPSTAYAWSFSTNRSMNEMMLIHVVGRAGHVIDLIDTQLAQVGEIVGRHLGRDLRDRDATLVALVDQLVIDIGDVDDPRHVVADCSAGSV